MCATSSKKIAFAEFDPLQDLIDNTSEVVMMLSPDLKFLFVNKAFRETFGFSSEEVIGMFFPDILHPQFKSEVMAKLEEVKKGKKVSDFQVVARNKQLKRVYLQGDIDCRFENNIPVNFRCLFRDITQRRRAERAQNLYYSIAQANLNAKDLKEFLKRVHEELQKKIYANNFFVAIYEPENGSIDFPYRVDEHYETPEADIRKIGNGIVEYAILHNKPLLLYKNEFEELVKKEKLFLYGKELPEVQVIVPLKVDGKTTGVIGIKSYSDATKFSSSNLELLEFVSGQVALALVRKKAQEDLLLQTARLNAVFDSSSHLIWTVNKKRYLSSFNKNYSHLIQENLGFPPEINTSLEKVGWRLINANDRPLLREKYNLAFEGQPQYFEMHWGAPDEWYEFYLNPILSSESGEISEVSGIARDITMKRNNVMAIQRSEEKFRNIIESFIDIYYRTDLAGNVTMISPSVERHTGYALEDVLGSKVDRFFTDAEGSAGSIKTLLKHGSITNFEVSVKRKDGELRSFMLNIRMIKNKKGLPTEVEGIARDITELKRSALELQKAKEEAEHSLAVKERFLANMSHEIRTPMNGIIGMLDVLSETELESEQKDYVNTIRKSSQTLLTILNDILDLSKIEAGKMELHPVLFDLKELLDTLVALFNQKAFEKGNQIIYEIEENLPKYFLGDQTRLLQILSNLTSNAIKFTENGEVRIKVSQQERQGDDIGLRFEVIDRGIGISEEDQHKLFNAFQQLDNSTTKSFGGTGLGLAISRELSIKMNGQMGVKSKVGEGSNFWFTIFIKVSETAPHKLKKSADEIKLANYFQDRQPKLLLVDDNAINRKVAQEILQRSGCTVKQADSGQKAIDFFSEDPNFDMILMDIQMPEMDGIKATSILREKFGEELPPVVAMTAYSMVNDREKFLNSGFDGYVSKPIRAHTLVTTIEAMLEGKEIEKIPNVKKETKAVGFIADDIPAFDTAVINGLKEMVGAEMLSSVFEDFEKEAEEQIENTRKAFENKDVETIQKELHTLKGNSGTIGLMRLHEIVKDIEVPAKTGNLDDFEEKFKILEKEFLYFKSEYKNV
ncbi:PAS domain S-box protein [Marinilongibacter aquaticus]|uniref:PAS domain S-box protein n=1 Tax=Marinilongibacter aquaticus TaxID=2975157 RepID=UPI0021BD11B8|nr:PAS domain S-box protein [Marinilongibacter aquaticus]UBM58457.1 PAS domain S-box protein [Marinilongibacter aquaticus]